MSNFKILLIFLLAVGGANTITYICDTQYDCGCSKYHTTIMNSRIVNGEAAALGTWGWMASLQYRGQHFCGGTVIDARHIVTAGHCFGPFIKANVNPVSNVDIFVGTNVLSNLGGGSKKHELTAVTIHPWYDANDGESEYDIAVLTLRDSINFQRNSFVSPVCLPFFNSTPPADLSDPEYPAVGTNLVAIGWGYRRESVHTISDTLQQVTVQAIDKDDSTCRFIGQSTNGKIQLCAAVYGKDTCQDDSGGPLMKFHTEKKVWELIGITSYGYGCARPEYAGVYTRVAAYIDWIRQHAPTPAPTPPTTPTASTITPLTTRTTTTTTTDPTTTSTSTARSVLPEGTTTTSGAMQSKYGLLMVIVCMMVTFFIMC